VPANADYLEATPITLASTATASAALFDTGYYRYMERTASIF